MQMMRYGFAMLCVAGLGLAACDDVTAGGSGRVAVQLTDAPFPYAEVSRVDVFVVRVDAKTATTDSAGAANANDMSGWTTLATPNASINLLDLQGGKVSTLGTATLPNGTYQGFRIVIDPAQSSITLKDGSKPDIKWPSANRSGIKVNLTAPLVVSSDSSVFIIDFDIGRSFVMRGNDIRNNGLLFKPVVNAVATDITGTVSGTVKADSTNGTAVAGATVELLKDNTALTDTVSANVVRTTSTDANGLFTFGFVLPGTYELRVTPPATMTGYKATLLSSGVTLANSQTLSGLTVVVTK